MLRNWSIVYTGNLIGAVATAVFLYLSRQYTFGGGVVGLAALEIARAKTALGFVQAVVLGISCNALVCLMGADGQQDWSMPSHGVTSPESTPKTR